MKICIKKCRFCKRWAILRLSHTICLCMSKTGTFESSSWILCYGAKVMCSHQCRGLASPHCVGLLWQQHSVCARVWWSCMDQFLPEGFACYEMSQDLFEHICFCCCYCCLFVFWWKATKMRGNNVLTCIVLVLTSGCQLVILPFYGWFDKSPVPIGRSLCVGVFLFWIFLARYAGFWWLLAFAQVGGWESNFSPSLPLC